MSFPFNTLSLLNPQSVGNYLYDRVIGRSQEDLKRDLLWPIRRSAWIWPAYRIEGCETYNHRHLIEMKIPWRGDKTMQEHKDEMMQRINQSVESKEPISIVRLGDGEAFFLRGEFKGNIMKRHITNGNPEEKNLNKWRAAFHENDIKTFDTNWSLRRHWVPLEGDSIRSEYIPLSSVYALVATRDVFKTSNGHSMGIIGPESKLDLINELMTFPEYRNYLGLERFDEYLIVPETGAANDTEHLFEDLLQQSDGRCDVYLVGMGIAKLRLLAPLRDALGATIIDVGSGLDAIAGIIPKDRPYFGKWRNYKIKDADYQNIDGMTQYMPDEKLATFDVEDDVYLC